MIAKSSKWQPTQQKNVFFLLGSMKEISTMVALLMINLTSLASSGALLRLTRTTYTSAGMTTGVIADRTAQLKKMLKVGSPNCKLKSFIFVRIFFLWEFGPG